MKHFVIKNRRPSITTFIETAPYDSNRVWLFWHITEPDGTKSVKICIGPIEDLKETKRGWTFETYMLTGQLTKLTFLRPDWYKVELK